EMEGVEIMYMVSPTRVVGDENGKVIGLELVRNELGAPDAKGRRRPEPVEGSEFVVDLPLKTDRRGVPLLNQNLKTELPNVWAAGDYVINPTNFISSIGEGKRVADMIDQEVRGTLPKMKEME